MAFPLNCPAAAYSIAHADVVDLAAKNQIARECGAAIERLFANDGVVRKVSCGLPLSGTTHTAANAPQRVGVKTMMSSLRA
jgi:hypothetical protein